ncbi:16S rRNA (guanine(527)-N(7))-methyltransferase RsmG [Croceibacterium sp. TMG7-5b_MA50]|uniref:16S rRNA (guanine(527)-N(7))-methyltransferase RsmG n=1 Tax=Croceibacterium sp. TMG7-5b_MA50 TaxID=3121290 RepID=UPI0032221B3E
MIGTEAEAREYCSRFLKAKDLERLDRFAALLVKENELQNLVSASSLSAIWQRHFADSLQLLSHAGSGGGQWLDLGTGAGFPGLVIALAQPARRVVLVESRRRRVEWLMHAATELDLRNVTVEGSMLEKVVTQPALVISARAFAPLGRLLSLAARFSSDNTTWLLPKGRSAVQELAEQPASVQQMFHVEQSVTDPEAGILIGRGVPAT